ncbi:MAG: hypothetical protein QXP36_05075 [Conexivisphaerales archaeon]
MLSRLFRKHKAPIMNAGEESNKPRLTREVILGAFNVLRFYAQPPFWSVRLSKFANVEALKILEKSGICRVDGDSVYYVPCTCESCQHFSREQHVKFKMPSGETTTYREVPCCNVSGKPQELGWILDWRKAAYCQHFMPKGLAEVLESGY